MRSRLAVALITAAGLAFMVGPSPMSGANPERNSDESLKIENDTYRLAVTVAGGVVRVRLDDKLSGACPADGPYLYHAATEKPESAATDRLANAVAAVDGNSLVIRGKLLGLEVLHTFTLPKDRPLMEERIVLRNPTGATVALSEFEAGLTRQVLDRNGQVLSALSGDRLVAAPFRYRAPDPAEAYRDYSIGDLMARPARTFHIDSDYRTIYQASRHRCSEGWAWIHGDYTMGIFSFNQENMVFSVLSKRGDKKATGLRFGGAVLVEDEPAALGRMAPGQSVDLGVIRYESFRGGYAEAAYAYRRMLDEKGCHFPRDYNPPVHWEQLYDMSGAWQDRAHKYTKKIIEAQAAKGRDYSCESLYLDPGWDTDFGTFLWGEKWLGPRKEFIDEMRSKYGLKVSLHCPLASWMSHRGRSWGIGAVKSFDKASFRHKPSDNPMICLGSRQYLDTAEERLLANCADGVVFLMFDGTWWNGGCLDPNHGHPVPYRREDQIRVCVDLAQRIHKKYPDVLIEMHDMLAGGSHYRPTPIYYKYGLPGSYDEIWGFELMWNVLEDIKKGRAKMLYYADMGCNIPIYLHINLAQDNEHLLGLWWYASTCRHLGIGGTHADTKIAEAQKKAMREYRRLERFFKRGEFYGISEEIHLHVLPKEGAFVVNMFNLSDQQRDVGGSISMRQMGLDPDRRYSVSGKESRIDQGVFHVRRHMEPWSTHMIEVYPAGSPRSRQGKDETSIEKKWGALRNGDS